MNKQIIKNKQFWGLYLDRDFYLEFQHNARKEQKSAAELIRDLMREYNKNKRTELQKIIEENDRKD